MGKYLYIYIHILYIYNILYNFQNVTLITNENVWHMQEKVHPISFNPHTLLSKPPTHQPTTNLYSRTITFHLPNLHNQPTSKLSQHLSSSSSTQPGGACFPKNHLKIDTHPGPSLKLTSYTEKNHQVSSPKNGYKNRGSNYPPQKLTAKLAVFPWKWM